MDAKSSADRRQRPAGAGGGPRTAAGKRRSRLNSRKHGLSIPLMADRHVSKSISRLAKIIAGEPANDAILEQAFIVAECELVLQRIRRARVAALDRAMTTECQPEPDKTSQEAEAFLSALPVLSSLDRYERRTLSRRKRALQNLRGLQLLSQLTG